MDCGGSCSVPLESEERPDLSLLKPLWALYTKMLEKECEKQSGLCSTTLNTKTLYKMEVQIKLEHF